MSHSSQVFQDDVAMLYIGAFGRAPDASGFQFWLDQMEAGATPYQIMQSFSNTPEFISEYDGLTTVGQVTKLYLNVLDRAPDTAGLDYWVGQINSGAQTFPDVVFNLTNAAFMQVGTADGLLVQNKVQVGEFFAVDLHSDDTSIAQTAFNNLTSTATSAIAAEATLAAAVNSGAILTLTTGTTSTSPIIVDQVDGNGVQLILAAATATNYGNVQEYVADTRLSLHASKITFANTSITAVTDVMQSFTSAHMEAVNIISGGVAATGVGNTITDYVDQLDRTVQINISGAKQFTLGDVDVNTSATSLINVTLPAGLTAINGTLATGKLIINAGADDSVVGSNVTMTYDGLTIMAGSGGSLITNSARSGVVNGGIGSDDIILNGAGASATTGAGIDSVLFNALNQSADLSGLGVDTLIVGTGATVSAFLSELTTVSNANTGDLFDFRAINQSSTVTDVSRSVLLAPDITEALAAAAVAIGANQTGYFNYDRDTYVIANDAQARLSTGDAVVKLVGVYADFGMGPQSGEIAIL
jgi:hypothetical protein